MLDSKLNLDMHLKEKFSIVQGRTYKHWAGEASFKSGPFLHCKYERDIKESNVSSSC